MADWEDVFKETKHKSGLIPMDHEVRLASGAKMPLIEAVNALAEMENLLCAGGEAKKALTALRQFCLEGAVIPSPALALLSDHGIVEPDGSLFPSTREVILAALRGEGENLYLVPPYVDPRDRVMSDLIIASGRAIGFLSNEQMSQLLMFSPKDGLGPWTRQVKELRHRPPADLGPSTN